MCALSDPVEKMGGGIKVSLKGKALPCYGNSG